MPLALEPLAELSGERRLTGTLEAREHDHGGRLLGEAQAARLATEDADQLLVDDLDDLLRRVQRLGDLFTEGPLLDLLDEGAHHGQRDVRFQECDADLACGGVDVRLGQAPLAAEALECRCKAIGEGVEHGARRSSGVGGRVGRCTGYPPRQVRCPTA